MGGWGEGGDRKGREFQLVNFRNVNVGQFTGKQLNVNPYVPFSSGIRNLILTQGDDGEELLEIFWHMYIHGGGRFANKYIDRLAKQRHKVYDYSRANMAASMIRTGGVANGINKARRGQWV